MTFGIPLFFVKDKQAFCKDEGTLRLLGNPAQFARKLADSGAKLIHIIDMDAKKGLATNMDIYDKLTYFVNIEVECSESADIIERLLRVKARVVLELSTRRDLTRWKEHERLLVGMVKPDYSRGAEGVHDIIIENADDEAVARLASLKKRIITFETDYRKLDTGHRKLVWGVLKPISQAQ